MTLARIGERPSLGNIVAGVLAPVLAFFAGLALWPDLALVGATCALCAATRGFRAGFGGSAWVPAPVLAVSAGLPFILRSP